MQLPVTARAAGYADNREQRRECAQIPLQRTKATNAHLRCRSHKDSPEDNSDSLKIGLLLNTTATAAKGASPEDNSSVQRQQLLHRRSTAPRF